MADPTNTPGAAPAAAPSTPAAAPAAAPAAPAADRPAWLPPQFASPEQLVASFKETQAHVTRLSQSIHARNNPPAAAPAAVPGAPAPAPAAAVGVNTEVLQAELATHGKPSEESYAALERAGIPRQMFDTMIEGQKAIASAREKDAHEVAGSKEAWDTMMAWARVNMTMDEKQELQPLLFGTSLQRKFAAEHVKAKYTAANGSGTPPFAGGTPPASGATGVFQTHREYVDALKVAGRDQKKIEEIEGKLARSPMVLRQFG